LFIAHIRGSLTPEDLERAGSGVNFVAFGARMNPISYHVTSLRSANPLPTCNDIAQPKEDSGSRQELQ